MKKLLLLFCILFSCYKLLASHNRAGDIRISHVSGNTYKISIRTFTNTLGTTVDRCELILYTGDGDSIIIPRINGPSISCFTSNDGVMTTGICTGGIRYNVYEITHTYPGDGTYILSVEDPTRDASICNITNPVTTSFYLQAEFVISSFLGINNTPTYMTTPVICDTVSVLSYYNPSVVESDGDSLHYELINAMSSGMPIIPGFYLPDASTSFTIDSFNGMITWNTPVQICSYVFDIKITEWRNIGGTYYNIGNTMQEVWSQTTPYTGIEENRSQNIELNIFPNPSSSEITFKIIEKTAGDHYNLTICNSLGQLIKTIPIEHESETIPSSEFPAGIYFYTLSDGKLIVNKGKFVISPGAIK